jgi:NADPH-dependent 2,4-dienoyl-CoA reductase/sulfur reductase-like enzyme
VVFVGAGVRLNTDFLKNVDLHNPDKSILVDKHMKSSSGLYAAGDIARFPYLLEGGNKHVRIEHWGVAQNQGRVAALNILGKGVEFRNTPYFWSVQFPGSLRYAGYCESPEEILIFGTPETDGKFVALFGSGDKVQALSTLGRDPLCSAGSELLHRGTFPSLSSLKGLSVDQLSTRILELL